MTFYIGRVRVLSYGLVIAAAALAALLLMALRRKKAGLKTGTVLLFGVFALPLSFFLAHAFYWVCLYGRLSKTGISFWDLKRGGYMLYGAVTGSFAAAFITSKISREPFGKIADAFAAPFA